MFPDFLDIKKLVLLAHEQDNIVMVPIKEYQMAMNVFTESGQMLKQLWKYNVMIYYLDNLTENNQHSAAWRAIQKFFLVQEDKERNKKRGD